MSGLNRHPAKVLAHLNGSVGSNPTSATNLRLTKISFMVTIV